MPDIDNTLATKVQAPASIDVMGTLAKAAQLRQMGAESSLKEQELRYRQGVLDRNDQYYPTDLVQKAQAGNSQADLAGRYGNMLVQDQSPATRKYVIQSLRESGVPVTPLIEQHIMSAPASVVKKYGSNMQAAGQSATSNIEQNPGAISQRSQAQAGGSELGTMYGPPGGAPTPVQSPAGAGGSSAPGQAQSAPAAPLSLQERKLEAAGNAGKRVEEFNQYRQENEGASVQKVALRQLMTDAERVRTGAGADKEQAARKWLLAAGQLIPGLQGVADKYSDPVAAFESINKNAGLIARTAIKQVGGTAASELDAISKSLVGTETSQKGIMVNASQLVGLESYKQARFQAAQQYQDANGTLKGFASDFNKNAGPAAWVYMSLPPEERSKVAESMRKSPEGQRILGSIAKQLKYIHDNKLDEGID